MLVLKELVIRLGPVINKALIEFMNSVMGILTPGEKQRITEFYYRMEEYDRYLWALYAEFVKQVEIEYQQLRFEIHETFNEDKSDRYRAEHSVKLAEICGVPEEKIIRNHEQLDELFL